MKKSKLLRDYLFGIILPIGYTKNQFGSHVHDVDREQETKFRSQKFRRGHVQLFLVNLLVVGTSGLIQNSSISRLVFTISSFFLIVTITLIRYSILGLSDLPNEYLDEREYLIKSETYLLSYKLLALGISIIFLAGLFLVKSFDYQTIKVLAVVVISTLIALPSALIAWRSQTI